MDTSPQAPAQPEIWQKYLKNDEQILWEGQPYAGVQWRRGDMTRVMSGVLLLAIFGVATFVAINIADTSDTGSLVFLLLFEFFMSIFLFGGLYAAVFQFHFAAKQRGRTHYAITNKRAMALITGKKPKFEDGPLDATTNLDYVPGEFASIYYKKTAKLALRSIKKAGESNSRTTYSTEYIYQGFELVPDGAKAYQTMLGVLGAKLASPEAATAGKNGEAWQDFLFEGEELLWQGAPGTGPRPTKVGVVVTVIGVLIMMFFGPVIMRALSANIDDPGIAVMGGFAALMFLLGLWMAVGHWLRDIKKRKATRYALTTQRAFVASSPGKRKMLTFALTADYRPLLLKGLMDEVTFGEEYWFNSKGEKTKRAISFEFLKDGKEVYDLLTKNSIRLEEEAETA